MKLPLRPTPVVPILGVAACLAVAAACSSPDEAGVCQGLRVPDAAASSGAGSWEEQGLAPELRELWRAGGLEEGQGMVFPVGVSAGSEGRIAIPDFRAGQTFVVAPDGEWLGSWTRRGRGPGEVLRPVAATWTEDGQLAVFDIQGAKVTWVAGPGEATNELQLDSDFTAPVIASGSLRWAAVGTDGTSWLSSGPSTAGTGTARAVDVVTRLRAGAGAPDTVLRDTVPTIAREGRFARTLLPGVPRPVAALEPDGDLLYASRDGSYVLRRIGSSDGQSSPVLCRDAPPRSLSDEERARGDVPSGAEQLAEAVRDASPPDELASIGGLIVGTEGRVWVQRKRPSPFGQDAMYGPPGGRWEVFSSRGEYLGSVAPPGSARLQAARGDTVWAIEIGDLDERWIVAYELELTETGESS